MSTASSASAELDVGRRPEVLSAFPFPHLVEVEATLRESALTIATTVRPTADITVPVTFGYHPYLRLPNMPRAAWRVEMPMTAPTDALRGCLGPPPAVSPGECYRARFTITVERES